MIDEIQCANCGDWSRGGGTRGYCWKCYTYLTRHKLIKTNDRLFAPGQLYIMHGKANPSSGYCTHKPESIHKIGVTSSPIHRRLTEVRWHNQHLIIELVHHFPVDNMRVVEAMFHTRYQDRVYDRHYPEWFHIEDKVTGLIQCARITVMDCLSSLSGGAEVYDWWWGLSPEHRRGVVRSLWKNPLLNIDLKTIVKAAESHKALAHVV